jgi:hypothetical protein
MWGNKLGWGISGLLVIVMVGLILLINAASTVSPPSAFSANANNMAALELPVDPKVVITMDDACDAADSYKQAIADYEVNSMRYERFITPTAGMDVNEGAALKGVQMLLKAKDCANMTLFTNMPEKVITYDQKPEIEALRSIGRVTNNIGLLMKMAGRDGEALRYHEAVFALGAKLYAERVAWPEVQLGLEMMSTAATSIGSLAEKTGDTNRQAEMDDFRQQYREYYEDRIKPVLNVISSIDQGVIRRHAGDIFEIANRSNEKMWRVEAILKLGRMKYDVGGSRGRFGDQMGAKRYIKSRINDSDPLIKRAAQAAKDLTIEQYRSMR